MSRDLLDKSYSPEAVEKRWYDYWEQEKLFAADESTTSKP
jgi:valyl-tRNA synthetase